MKHLNSITVALFLSAASVMALTACGGGGSGDTSAGSGGTGGSSTSTSTESTSSTSPTTTGSESGSSTTTGSTGSTSSTTTTGSTGSTSSTTTTGSGGMAGGASLSKDVQPILTASCAKAGCHNGSQFPNFSDGKTFASIANNSKDCKGDKVVTPGTPNKSSLYNKISGTTCGSRMPLGGAPLSDDKIKTIEDWITAGAKND